MTVFVVGSLNADFLVFAERFPATGETVVGQGWERQLGGKGANQAVAAAKAGARTVLAGAVGDDPMGEPLRRAVADYGVDIGNVATVRDATGFAAVTVAGGDNRIVMIPGANLRIEPAAVMALPMQAGDVCVAQWETSAEVVATAFRHARERGALTLFNPAPADDAARDLFALADVIVVNETEFAAFTGLSAAVAGEPDGLRRGRDALRLQSNQALVVTLGAAGCAALRDERYLALAGHPLAVVDTTGAGDCFSGYLAAGLEAGQTLEVALVRANAAAALSVQLRGAAAAMPQRPEVDRFIGDRGHC